MANFKQDSRFGKSKGPKKSFGDRPSFGGGRGFDGPSRSLFQATCSSCGSDCEVPFKPSGTKPVLCNNCFGKAGASSGSYRDSGHRGDASYSPRGPRPSESSSSSSDQVSRRLEMIETKLDIILKLLSVSE